MGKADIKLAIEPPIALEPVGLTRTRDDEKRRDIPKGIPLSRNFIRKPSVKTTIIESAEI
jgi:hypothetical protein